MLFVKTIALALLVSTARSIPMPEPEPNPQTVPYTQASSQALAVWSENTCSNFETYHNELDADYQVVIGDFNEEANSLAVRLSSFPLA
jgi:hypothetical protein